MREDEVADRLGFPGDYLSQRLIQEFVAKFSGNFLEWRLGRFRSKADLYDTFTFFLEMQITAIGEAIGYAQQR